MPINIMTAPFQLIFFFFKEEKITSTIKKRDFRIGERVSFIVPLPYLSVITVTLQLVFLQLSGFFLDISSLPYSSPLF